MKVVFVAVPNGRQMVFTLVGFNKLIGLSNLTTAMSFFSVLLLWFGCIMISAAVELGLGGFPKFAGLFTPK